MGKYRVFVDAVIKQVIDYYVEAGSENEEKENQYRTI